MLQALAADLPSRATSATIRQAGFTDVTPLTGELAWRGIRITRREGNHGTGAVLDKMGSGDGLHAGGGGRTVGLLDRRHGALSRRCSKPSRLSSRM